MRRYVNLYRFICASDHLQVDAAANFMSSCTGTHRTQHAKIYIAFRAHSETHE